MSSCIKTSLIASWGIILLFISDICSVSTLVFSDVFLTMTDSSNVYFILCAFGLIVILSVLVKVMVVVGALVVVVRAVLVVVVITVVVEVVVVVDIVVLVDVVIVVVVDVIGKSEVNS